LRDSQASRPSGNQLATRVNGVPAKTRAKAALAPILAGIGRALVGLAPPPHQMQ
jgi:hypothetical protein